MSSILKALKKLETETAGSQPEQPLDPRKTIRRNVKGIWLLNKLMTILITILCVMGIGWGILVWKPDVLWRLQPKEVVTETKKASVLVSSAPSTTIPLAQEKAAIIDQIPNETTKTSPSVTQKTTIMMPSLTDSEKKTSKPIIVITSDMPSLQKKDSFDLDEKKHDGDNEQHSEDDVSESTDESQQAHIESQETPIAPSESDSTNETDQPKIVSTDEVSEDQQYDQTPLLSDGRLKIQALVWSKNPVNRFAVINDRVVKTGGIINDVFSVAYIGNNFVIVHEGNKQWKVEFHIK